MLTQEEKHRINALVCEVAYQLKAREEGKGQANTRHLTAQFIDGEDNVVGCVPPCMFISDVMNAGLSEYHEVVLPDGSLVGFDFRDAVSVEIVEN